MNEVSPIGLNPAALPLEDGPWLDRIDPAYLTDAFPEWAGASARFVDAVDAFRHIGWRQLAPPAADLAFEPEYYADARPEVADLPPVERYRYWLTEGLAKSHPGAEAAHLVGLGLALPHYPAAFQWEYYCRLRPSAAASRWSALADFLATGFASVGDIVVDGPQAAGFLCALGVHYSGKNDRLAIRAYELARRDGELPGHEQQHLADAYLREELWRPALDLYRGLMTGPHATAWTFRNAIRCARQLDLGQELYLPIVAALPRLAGDPLWPDVIRDAMRAWFDEGEQSARRHLAAGRIAEADALLGSQVATLAAQIELLLPAVPSPPATGLDTPRILFLANLDDPIRVRRRIDAKVAMLDRLGLACEIIAFSDMDRFVAALPGARAVVAFRVPALPDVLCGLVMARRKGCRLYYDIDEMLDTPEHPVPIAAYRGFVSRAEYDGLQFAHALYRAAARLCDVGLGPTERIARAVGALCLSGRGVTIGGADGVTIGSADGVTIGGADGIIIGGADGIIIGGAPDGPAAPEDDAAPVILSLAPTAFTYVDCETDPIGAALREVLLRRPEVRLSIAGPVKLGAGFTALARQIRRDEPGTGAPVRPDIVLVIADASADGEYQALCAWEAAAARALPSVVRLDQGALPMLVQSENVRRAATAAEWRDAVLELIDDRTAGRRLGAAARASLAASVATGRDSVTLHETLSGGALA